MRRGCPGMKRQYSLDVLRIIATILIIFHHYQQITGTYFEGSLNFHGGDFSFGMVVEFFFVLSGFLAQHYISKIKAGCTFQTFILQKAKRLLPLVFISSVTYEVLLFVYKHVCQTSWLLGNDVTIWGTIITGLGIQAGWVFENPAVNNPTWYISVLLLCYVIFYFLVYVSNRKHIPDTYLYIGMVFLGVGVYSHNIHLPFLNEFSSRGFYAFFFGLLLAKVLAGRALNGKWCLASLAVVILSTYGLLNHYIYFDYGILYFMTFLYYPACIIFCLSQPVTGIFCHKVLGTLGAITFDAYIWHLPMMLLMYILLKLLPANPDIQTWQAMLLFTVSAFGVGTLSHFLMEKPINRLTSLR